MDRLDFLQSPNDRDRLVLMNGEIAMGLVKGHGRIVLVQPEQGSVEIKKLQRLLSDKVKSSGVVTER